VPPEPLITGAFGATLLGKDIYQKAMSNNRPLETKSRVLETVQILWPIIVRSILHSKDVGNDRSALEA